MTRSALKRGFTLIELMIVVAIIGILAALAIPNFMRFQAKSKQSEAKANLKSIFTAEKSLAAERDSYSPYVEDIGFSPERGNRYAYFLTAGSVLEARSATTIAGTKLDTGISADGFKYGTNAADLVKGAPALITAAYTIIPTTAIPATTFSASAQGNIDNETTGLDVWQVSSESYSGMTAKCGNSETVSVGGAAYNSNNDVSCDTAP